MNRLSVANMIVKQISKCNRQKMENTLSQLCKAAQGNVCWHKCNITPPFLFLHYLKSVLLILELGVFSGGFARFQ